MIVSVQWLTDRLKWSRQLVADSGEATNKKAAEEKDKNWTRKTGNRRWNGRIRKQMCCYATYQDRCDRCISLGQSARISVIISGDTNFPGILLSYVKIAFLCAIRYHHFMSGNENTNRVYRYSVDWVVDKKAHRKNEESHRHRIETWTAQTI